MKHNIYILLLAIAIGFTQCCKEKPTSSNNNDIPGLPPATQTGANTLGFLLNGVPWVPAGNNGTANLSIDFDQGINNGGMGIAAYRGIAVNNVEYFGIGIIDSLNFKSSPFDLLLGNRSLFRCRFERNSCDYLSIDTLIKASGSLTISKLDRIQNIIAGTFYATLIKSGCDTIRLTEGRFDMKF
jgi:hypothetical protein